MRFLLWCFGQMFCLEKLFCCSSLTCITKAPGLFTTLKLSDTKSFLPILLLEWRKWFSVTEEDDGMILTLICLLRRKGKFTNLLSLVWSFLGLCLLVLWGFFCLVLTSLLHGTYTWSQMLIYHIYFSLWWSDSSWLAILPKQKLSASPDKNSTYAAGLASEFIHPSASRLDFFPDTKSYNPLKILQISPWY